MVKANRPLVCPVLPRAIRWLRRACVRFACSACHCQANWCDLAALAHACRFTCIAAALMCLRGDSHKACNSATEEDTFHCTKRRRNSRVTTKAPVFHSSVIPVCHYLQPALNRNPSKRTWNSASENDRCTDDIGTLQLLASGTWPPRTAPCPRAPAGRHPGQS